jgi:hypothetical protein
VAERLRKASPQDAVCDCDAPGIVRRLEYRREQVWNYRKERNKMPQPSELDRAQLKFEMRQLYRNLGFETSLQILCEMVIGAEILSEVIVEERKKESK